MANLDRKTYSRYTDLYKSVQSLSIIGIPQSYLTDPDDIIHIFKDSDKTFLLSDKYLGDPRFWWVICLINNKKTPDEFISGEDIRIPSDINIFFNKIDSYLKLRK